MKGGPGETWGHFHMSDQTKALIRGRSGTAIGPQIAGYPIWRVTISSRAKNAQPLIVEVSALNDKMARRAVELYFSAAKIVAVDNGPMSIRSGDAS